MEYEILKKTAITKPTNEPDILKNFDKSTVEQWEKR